MYKKHHGCDFLWEKDQYLHLDELTATETAEDISANKTSPTVEQINDFKKVTKKELCKKVIAMAI